MLPFTGLETYRKQDGSDSGHRHARQNSHPGLIRRFWRGRQRSRLVSGLFLLCALILAPILVGVVHSLTTPGLANGSSPGTTAHISLARLQGIATNPHELVIFPPRTDHPTPPVLATSAYLLDSDSETTLYAHNPFLHLPMLSTTKLMTASLAIQMGKLDQQITITPAMEADITQLSTDSALFGVKPGETYTLRDIIYGLLYVSGNDAALILADALAGSVQNFVTLMNQKAQELGMRDTHFVNPHGLLDPGQYSCARDLAILGQYSLSIPLLQEISSGKVYHISAEGKHGARVMLNENQFLWWYPGVTGGKTGYDGVSDFVQVMQVTRNHRHMIGVVMHSVDWWTDMRDLMDYGSVDYAWNSPRDTERAGQVIPYDTLWNFFARDTQELSVPIANNGRYYVFSGYSIAGPVLPFFDANGGLKTFGFPLNMPVPVGSTLLSQRFQHGQIICDSGTNQCRKA
jgi:D-alanyl-D-alanine carboxypeptidase